MCGYFSYVGFRFHCSPNPGFLVLLLKGRAVTKTSPVLRSLKALGIRPSEAEQRLCRQRVWVGNDTLMTPREQHFFRALLRHTSRTR
ncbi:TPA: hypothetical protein RFG05_005508, partial [Klebsiella pneumoniae]|nr:hypothetical protein [Klebsiella pneumoniae]